MPLAYAQDIQDRLAFIRASMARSPFIREVMAQQRQSSVLTILALGAVGSVAARSWAPLLACSALAVLYYLGFKASFTKGYLRNAQRQQEVTNARCLGHLHRIDITPRGLATSCDSGEALYPWPTISDLVDTPTHLLVFLQGDTGFAIPRGKVVEGDLDAFRDEARAKQRSAGG